MSFFSSVADLFKPAPPPPAEVTAALARVGHLVDPMLLAASDARQALTAPLAHALGYCDGLVAALPGPFEVSRQTFASDPLVHALFATADDIGQMLGRSPAVRDFLADTSCFLSDHFYAMLAARRQEKHQLGLAMEGDVLRSEVPQTVVYFSEQTLIEPSCRLEDTLNGLRQRALDSLLQTFHAHVEALRHERDGLRADLAMARAHRQVHEQAAGHVLDIETRHIEALDARLRVMADELSPDQLLAALGEFLLAPEPSLALTAIEVHIDRLGVLSNDDGPAVEHVRFPELHARDKRRHTVILARFSRAEAEEAVARVTDAQRRYLLI